MGHEIYKRFERERNQKEIERLVEESGTMMYSKPPNDLQAQLESMQQEYKEGKPKKGTVIHITNKIRGISMMAVVDDISKDGTRMTLSRIEEDE